MDFTRLLRLRVTYLLVGGFGLTIFLVMATLATTPTFLRLVWLRFGSFGNGEGYLLSLFLGVLSF